MVIRSLSPTMAETFASSNHQSLEAAMERAAADPFAGVTKRIAAMERAAADPFAGVAKRMAAMERAAADPFAGVKRMAAMERAAADPFAGFAKRMAAMERAAADPFAGFAKRMAAMERAAADPFAGFAKRMAAMERAAADPFAGFAKRMAAMERAAVDPFAGFAKRMAATQRATVDPFADLSKSLPRLQRSARPPLAEMSRHRFPHPVRRVIDRVPEVLSVAGATIVDGTRFRQSQFDLLVTDGGLRQTCRNLFVDGHHAEAVRKAYTYIDNQVRDKSGQVEKYGADLMHAVFSANKPLLKVNDLQTRSDWDEQKGYMEMLAGAMIGIRNPRSHEYDFVDRPEEALELLVMANHFMRMLNKATPT